MNAEYPSLADHLATHQWSFIKHGCRCDDPGTVGEWPEHVATSWAEACTIRTIQQLEALPDDSTIRVIDGGEINRKTSRRDGSAEWWTTGSEEDIRSTVALLPALLIDHPEWRTS